MNGQQRSTDKYFELSDITRGEDKTVIDVESTVEASNRLIVNHIFHHTP